MAAGTVFTCTCPADTGTNVISFPTTSLTFTHGTNAQQTLRAECVAEDTYQITVTPQGFPPEFPIPATQQVKCENI